MKQPNFNSQIINTINNEKTTIEELKAIEPILNENYKASSKLMYTYYFITLVLSIIWFLIDNSIISEVKVFDLSIDNRQILMLAIPFIAIASNYITISYMAFNQLIDSGLRAIHSKIYPNISEESIAELLIHPSLIELETIKLRLSNDSFFSSLGFLFIAIIFGLLPIILNGIICYKLYFYFKNSAYIFLTILYILILFKIITNLIFYFRQVQ
ncbi:hypothetical protein C8C83_3710 [Flavobacterium sp. 90]|uniref:hypothetical protein n=1 Tax=unclassified Flavobacterium TaxID=196869 RepID=UPI000EB219A8|nr:MULTISPECIES: hypothetical protein [unclassified Flavobacterium]RKR11951.1 hypothetical protein C8C82_4029 [Flavobacterium sp. 81]TCK55725.1 hypothetical protein C8C83_3710 [Flavobacterium sp. 90]